MFIDDENKADRYDKHLTKCAAVIATNTQLFDIAAAVNPDTVLIPNGVDLELFQPAKVREGHEFTVGFSGNIWGLGASYKGWAYYVAAVLPLYPDVRRRESLFNGPSTQAHIPHDRMKAEFFDKIDCLILPSINEGCSNVVGEALACGVPVLCTKVGYHGERLTDGENVIFIERDAEDISDKIMMLKGSPELRDRLSINGRKFVEDNQAIEKIARQYDQVIEQVMNKGA